MWTGWFLAMFCVLDPPIFQAETRDGSKYCTRFKAPLNVKIPWQVPYKVSGRFPKHFHGRALNLAPRSWIWYGSRMGCAWSFSFKKQVPNLMIHTYKNSFFWWSNVWRNFLYIYIYIFILCFLVCCPLLPIIAEWNQQTSHYPYFLF